MQLEPRFCRSFGVYAALGNTRRPAFQPAHGCDVHPLDTRGRCPMTNTTAPDRAAINRRNAQKSTGPRTAEGKSRSKFNALKHGMTAATPVLPGEDPDAFHGRIDAWKADLKPQGDLEDYLIERAARVSWQLDRADRTQTAQLASNMRHAGVDADS